MEYQQNSGNFVVPSAKTVREMLEEYVFITWALSTCEGRRELIDNYIKPVVGDMKLDSLTPRTMDWYYRDLLSVKSKPRLYQSAQNEFLSLRIVKEIHKLLRNVFDQAVKWGGLILRNPVAHATLPKSETKPCDIWTADTLFHALELCDDDLLKLALNLAFSCSLRMGEMLALTWNCIDITPESMESGRASIYVSKELQRVQREFLQALDGKGVIKMFSARLPSRHTALVLKELKTKTSVRRVFLPKTVAEMLAERHREIEDMKELFGEEYTDYDLVFCSPMGHRLRGR